MTLVPFLALMRTHTYNVTRPNGAGVRSVWGVLWHDLGVGAVLPGRGRRWSGQERDGGETRAGRGWSWGVTGECDTVGKRRGGVDCP